MNRKKILYKGQEVILYRLEDAEVNIIDDKLSCGEGLMPGQVPMITILATEVLDADKEESYVAEVIGDSMTGAGIEPGDRTIINTRKRVRDGDIVLAAIDNEFLLKYYHEDELGNKWLVPANKKYKPKKINADGSTKIWGVMVSHIKSRKRSDVTLIGTLDKLCKDELQVVRTQAEIPSWVCGNIASCLFQVAIDNELLDENYQPKEDVPVWKLGGLADKIGDVLKVKHKWVEFGELWSINKDYLRNSWINAKDLTKERNFTKNILNKIY